MRAPFAWLLTLALAGCFTPNLGDGNVACGADGLCPPKYFCHAADQRCYKTPDPGGGVDMASGDLAGVIVDLAGADLTGADFSMCTKALCGARNCGTIPDECGGVETCGGGCPGSKTCGGGNPGSPNICGSGPACTPKTCQAGVDCGLISDGCSAVLNCGLCSGSMMCGSDHKCH
ncbi:MAG TPA: hypothetical protein VF945_06720 [Polyangia bacterium]